MGLSFNPSVQKGITPTAPTLLSSPAPAAALSLSATPGATPAAAAIPAAAPAQASAAKSPAALDMACVLANVVKMMSQMLSMVTGQPVPAGGTPFTGALPAAKAGTPGVAAPAGAAPAGDAGPAINFFTADDYKNFLLAGSKGGTQGTDEKIEARFADPNSRFAKSPQDQFNASVAAMYANQFKANALGLDAAFAPGKDINQLSANLVQASNVQMAPEAELLAKVAATYRGTGSVYNNPALKQLLIKWGRSDIASQPNVGDQNGDVQSVGGIVKALNEEKDPAIRKAWLQEIFDFAGNTPSSPSGAVPDLANYQLAISKVRGGEMAQLLSQYAAR